MNSYKICCFKLLPVMQEMLRMISKANVSLPSMHFLAPHPPPALWPVPDTKKLQLLMN